MFTRFKEICYDLEMKYAKLKTFTIAEKFPREKFAKSLNKIYYSATQPMREKGECVNIQDTGPFKCILQNRLKNLSSQL